MQSVLFWRPDQPVQSSISQYVVPAGSGPTLQIQAPVSGWRDLRGINVCTKNGTALVTRYTAQFSYKGSTNVLLPNKQDPLWVNVLDAQDSGFNLDIDSAQTVNIALSRLDGANWTTDDVISVAFYHTPENCR